MVWLVGASIAMSAIAGIAGTVHNKKEKNKQRNAELVQYQENLALNEQQQKERDIATSNTRKRAEQLGVKTKDSVKDQLKREHDDLESDILAIS